MTCCSCTLNLAVTVIEVSKLAESNEGLMCRMIMPGSDNARPTDLLQVCECDVLYRNETSCFCRAASC